MATKRRSSHEAQLSISQSSQNTSEGVRENAQLSDVSAPSRNDQEPSAKKDVGVSVESKPPVQASERQAAGLPSVIRSVRKPEETDISKADRQEFFLPVSGFVWLLRDEEVSVVDHPAFQRLGRIYQLGQAFLVYRGATHKRLEHVLGALHVVQRMIGAVSRNSEKRSRDSSEKPPLLVAWSNVLSD